MITQEDLKTIRERGYSDDEIWSKLAETNSDFSTIKERGYSLEEVVSITSGKPMPEPEPVGTSIGDTLQKTAADLEMSIADIPLALGEAFSGLTKTVPASFYAAKEGLARPDQYSKEALAAFDTQREYFKKLEQEAATRKAEGRMTTAGEAVRGAGQSLGFTVAGMAPAIAGGAIAGAAAGALFPPAEVATIPIGAIAGGIGSMVASAPVSYRMAGGQFLYDAFKSLEENKGSPLTEEEKTKAYNELLPIAQNTALWEAGPEAIGNAVQLGALKYAFGFGKKAATNVAGQAIEKANNTLLKKVGAVAGGQAIELAGETITQTQQGADQAKMEQYVQTGSTAGAPNEYEGLAGAVKAFKEVAPTTLALGAITAGAGGVVKVAGMGGKEVGKVLFTKPKTPEQIAEDQINDASNRVANDLSISPDDTEANNLNQQIKALSQVQEIRKQTLAAIEPTSREAQTLKLDIAEGETMLGELNQNLTKLTGLSLPITEAEKQQIELGKQIAEKPAEVIPEVTPQVTEVVTPPTEVTPEVIAPVTEVTPTTEVVATTEVTPEVVTPDEIKAIEVTQEQIDTTAKEFGATPEGAKAIVENKPFESSQSQRLPDGWFTEAYEGKFFAIPPAIVKIRMPAQAELRKLSILERAALAGDLSTEKIVNQTDATTYILEAKKQGFTTEEINAATPEARAKWDQRFGVAGNARTVAGEVSPPSVDFAAEEAARSGKPKVTSGNVLPANKLFGKTAREALQYLADQNLGASELEREGRPLNTSQKMQRAASVIAKLPLRILDADFIKSGKGGNRAYRANEGFIRIPATYRGQTYYEDPTTLVHEVGHTLTADAVRKYVFDRAKMRASGSQYLRALDNSLSDQNTPEQIKKLISLYKKTIDELGLTNDYFGANGLASVDATSSQKKAYRRKKPLINKFTGKKIGWSELYALANLDEFVAQAWSSPAFQDLLKSIKVKNEPSIFEQFVRIIKDLFGFESDTMAAAVIDASFALAELEAPATIGTVEERIAENIAREKGKKAPKSPTQAEPTPTIKESLPVAPAAEPTPIEPEAKIITEGLVQGIDIGKENNMPINNKIESHIKNFAFVRGIFESASDRLRRAKFTKLATAIDDYYDQAQRRLGFANKILLPAFDEYSKQSKATKKKIDEEVKRFFAAQENKRDTAEFFDELNPITQKIVTAWQKFGEESGSENQRIGIKVFDKGLQRWRPIGKVEKFWPRVLKPEYKRALMEPDKYQKEYNEIVDALMKSGRIQTPEEAEVFISDYQGTGSQNDYFSGIEAARGQAFPEELYDYSTQVMTDYVARWAQHSSRIEQFGQKLGENSKTLWDRSRESTRDRRTIDYITAAQERVEGYFPNDSIVKGMSTMGIWTSGFQLGNFSSSMLNFFGGTTLNAMVGQPGALSSYLSSFIELRNLGRQLKDAREKGIVSRDLMNIIGDHQVVLESSGLAKAGQKTSDFLLKWSGFTPVEQMVRTQSMIIGKSFLRKTLSSLSKNPNSSFSKQALTWLNRNNIDADKLIVEQGTGPETDKLLRYFANISQGSYTIAQTPIFIDTPIGRFLFKYQKFSTQVMRQSWKNTFEPAWKAVTNKNETLQLPEPTRQLLYRLRLEEAKELGDNRKITLDEIPKKVTKSEGKALTIIPVMMWLGSAYVGGEVILRMRDMIFGVLMKGPSYEDIIRAFEDDEDDDELYLALERAWYNLIGMGALGLIGNYAQFFMDLQDRERVKNPLDPPALSIVKETGTFIQNAVDQGKITIGDINDYLNRTLSAYRVAQRAYQTAASGLGYSDAPTVAEEMFRREVASINKYARRWAESAGLEYRTRRPSDLPTSKMTPINRKISSYLQRGEPGAAAAYAKEYLKSLPKNERANAIQSMESGARNRQPLRLGSGPMDQAEKIAFKKWLKEKVSKEKFDEIQKLDSQYQKNYRVFLNNLPNK